MSEKLFKPTIIFFGLTNSPATFQTIINEILQISELKIVTSFISILNFYFKFLNFELRVES